MSAKCPKCQFENPDDTLFCGKCATRLPSPEKAEVTKTLETPKEELTTGSTFAGRYQIIEELGKGGMGKVYKANDTDIKEKVAIKLIKPEISTDKKTIERFQNELKFARKIRHKNVCQMYDLNKEKGTYYITMEYVSGEDLKGFIRRSGQLAVGTTIRVAKQVCEGLSEAHKLGVVHRDLKPSNIMIDKDGNARIMDFGIARSLEAKGITGAGVMIGTPEYMSPEQVEGKEVDQRSDIYSLGIILYEMVTGGVPFEGDTPFTIGMKHKGETPKNPKELNNQISDDLNRVILRCLEKDREKRYQNAEEIFSELASIERGIPTTERDMLKRKTRTEKLRGVGWKKSILYGGAAALVILLIVVGFSLFTGRQEAMDSIAVLPLENQSGDAEQEYFADGMTDALITELSKIGALRVISRTSVMGYKGTDKLLPEIARELGVDVLVVGSVLHAENKVRIMVQLIKATPEKHLWADDYERDLDNVIAMQKEIAQAIAREIKITIRPEEQARLTQSRPINPEAYQLYLKGRFFWNKRTEEGVRRGLEYFQDAIEKDPSYALAYVGLADSYIIMGWYDWASPQETFPKAKRAVEKALEIDNTLAEAHTSLAAVSYLYEWDWLSAEREFKRAIEINPSHSTAHRWYSSYLASMDRNDEALAESRRALELDPISLITNANAALRLIYSRRPEDAIKQLQKTLEMDPNFVPVYNYLRIAYLEKEMYQEAIDAAQKAVNLSQGDSICLSFLGSAYAAAGKRDKALKILAELNELSKKRYVSSYTRATIYLSLGDIDQFFEWMERAYLERNWQLTGLYWPLKDSIRSDPRFKALLKKMNLE